jgi:hypothetical protein
MALPLLLTGFSHCRIERRNPIFSVIRSFFCEESCHLIRHPSLRSGEQILNTVITSDGCACARVAGYGDIHAIQFSSLLHQQHKCRVQKPNPTLDNQDDICGLLKSFSYQLSAISYQLPTNVQNQRLHMPN